MSMTPMASEDEFMEGRAGRRSPEAGVALLSALLVLVLLSALLVGFISSVNADQMASGANRDQTQAYAAAHAGVEKLTADLGQLFEQNFAPTNAQVDALATAAMQPTIGGIQYVSPNGTTGYRITYTDTRGANGQPPADGSPDLKRWDGWPISSGQYEGLTGLITPYNIEVTARTTGGAEVRMRREIQTVGIPVFQFGIFSENDLSFFAGPNFAFGGRVHSNQHLFLKQDSGNTLTLQDRVSAVGEIIRDQLANGISGTHTSTVRMALAAGCPAAPAAATAACRNLAGNEGSVVGGPTSAQNEPTWTNLSMGTYNGWIRNGRTGARRLDLPLVSDGARPVDIIRRAPVGEPVDTDLARQRFYNLATVRVLMSDRPTDLTALPGAVGTPVPLQGVLGVLPAEVQAGITLPAGNHPFATSPATGSAAQVTAALDQGFRTTGGTSLIGGFILINRQDRDGTWTDVTKEILNLGFAGKRLSDGTLWMPNWNNNCVAPHPNAVVRVQRYRENIGTCGAAAASTTNTDYWPNVLYDPREGMLRDNQAGRPTAPAGVPNITAGWQRLYWSGVMHYVELDVNNLRRWLRGDFNGSNSNACLNGAGPSTCPMDVTGYVLYFSDRRTNKGTGPNGAVNPAPTVTAAGGGVEVTYGDDDETGELGFEDNINTNANSQPNGVLDHAYVDVDGNARTSEDLNWELPTVPAANAPGRGTLQTYGATARLLPVAPAAGPWPANQMLRVPAAVPNQVPNGVPSTANYTFVGANGVFGQPIDRNVARVNRAFFFRRALKLVNGGRMQLPANGSQGLTVASENPVYIEGNYNACSVNINQATGISTANTGNNFLPGCVGGVGFGNTPGVDHVSAAVIADSVTLLSNAWNDLRSFVNPHDASQDNALPFDANDDDARGATTTWYRTAIISGKGLNFPRAATGYNGATDGGDWGTDGGAHNFLRYIENWSNETLNYRGSIISFYTNRQAVGVYKCCDVVYSPPNRGFNFDTEFLTPALLPPRTPMFRTLNTLSFRQVLRPTQ
jgi:hypothetical protein